MDYTTLCHLTIGLIANVFLTCQPWVLGTTPSHSVWSPSLWPLSVFTTHAVAAATLYTWLTAPYTCQPGTCVHWPASTESTQGTTATHCVWGMNRAVRRGCSVAIATCSLAATAAPRSTPQTSASRTRYSRQSLSSSPGRPHAVAAEHNMHSYGFDNDFREPAHQSLTSSAARPSWHARSPNSLLRGGLAGGSLPLPRCLRSAPVNPGSPGKT
jgi:hypothetical protein